MLRKPYRAIAGLLLALLVVFLVARFTAANRHLDVAVAGSSAGPVDSARQSAPQPAPPLRISAAQLYSEYDENAVAANDEFSGRTLEVTGRILGVDDKSGAVVRLRMGVDQYGFNDIEAQLAKGSDATVTQLKKGQSVTLVCTGVHRALGSVTLDRCHIAPIE